jgi:hypothetical protein
MKVLGIAATQRVSTMPNVPTFTEQGFQGFDIESWIGLYAPAKTPSPSCTPGSTALREIHGHARRAGAPGRLRLRAAGQHAGASSWNAIAPTTRASRN